MQYCEKCNVSVDGDRAFCPLCQGPLIGDGDECREVFPKIPSEENKYHLTMKILVFVSIAAVVISVAVNAILPTSSWWSLFVAAATVCMWICLHSILRRLRNIPKNILWMVFWISVLALLWDLFTGWRAWSINYVIPSICIFAMLAMAVIAKVMRLQIADFMVYLIIDALFGIVPILFLFTGWATVTYPSIICVAGSILSLGAIFSFEGERLRAEIKRRLHL